MVTQCSLLRGCGVFWKRVITAFNLTILCPLSSLDSTLFLNILISLRKSFFFSQWFWGSSKKYLSSCFDWSQQCEKPLCLRGFSWIIILTDWHEQEQIFNGSGEIIVQLLSAVYSWPVFHKQMSQLEQGFSNEGIMIVDDKGFQWKSYPRKDSPSSKT